MRLVSVLHDLLICDTTNKEKHHELHKYVTMYTFQPSTLVLIYQNDFSLCIMLYTV